MSKCAICGVNETRLYVHGVPVCLRCDARMSKEEIPCRAYTSGTGWSLRARSRHS